MNSAMPLTSTKGGQKKRKRTKSCQENKKQHLCYAVLLIGMLSIAAYANPAPVKARIADRLQLAAPGSVHIEGFLGQRIECNRTGRLKHIPMDELLEGFQHRPGKHPWIGEHIGKWLHAATLTWQYSNDAELKRMLDKAVKDLLATQKDDGYLGTYEDKDRWTEWDVWIHKYDLIGLLTYHRATGDEAALHGAKRIGDLLAATFGPQKRDIIAAGTHVGMAATSVLEPMARLYRATGDVRYLAVCEYIVKSWETPKGPGYEKRPKILSSLLDHGKVNQTANRKAYEMLSNLVGLCELYRVTGNELYLKAARIAWDDVTANQQYVTGGVSFAERFQRPDGHLPDTGSVAETCVNVTYMQLSMHLYALTGEMKYIDGIAHVIYNHLLAAQAEDGNDWCYFTVLQGTKKFLKEVNCCHSSGPRGVALIPRLFYCTAPSLLRINLYGQSQFKAELPDVGPVEIRQRTAYPSTGRIEIEVRPDKPSAFSLELRIPPWSKNYRLAVNGKSVEAIPQSLVVLDRKWQTGDTVTLDLDMAPTWIAGTREHADKMAARKGPLVLCASKQWNPRLRSMMLIGVEDKPTFETAGAVERHNAILTAFKGKVRTPEGLRDERVILGPFAMVQHEKLAVWLHNLDSLAKLEVSLLFDGQEGYSRRGYTQGSIVDGDASTYSKSNNGTDKKSDYWEVTLEEPVTVSRVVYRHGHVAHDGGWFDTSEGKPEIFVQTEKGGDWEKVGTLDTYPQTTADKPPVLEDGQVFELVIPPTQAYGIRIVGKPAQGDKANENYSSCAELQAYEK